MLGELRRSGNLPPYVLRCPEDELSFLEVAWLDCAVVGFSNLLVVYDCFPSCFCPLFLEQLKILSPSACTCCNISFHIVEC
ncbi:hypothetical protein EV2_030544 [Malus domestica]